MVIHIMNLFERLSVTANVFTRRAYHMRRDHGSTPKDGEGSAASQVIQTLNTLKHYHRNEYFVMSVGKENSI